jgi:hypothetical protein
VKLQIHTLFLLYCKILINPGALLNAPSKDKGKKVKLNIDRTHDHLGRKIQKRGSQAQKGGREAQKRRRKETSQTKERR